jgi:hypothetical protein
MVEKYNKSTQKSMKVNKMCYSDSKFIKQESYFSPHMNNVIFREDDCLLGCCAVYRLHKDIRFYDKAHFTLRMR